MLPLSEVPINSWAWLIGSAACLLFGWRSLNGYRSSRNELSKYVAWFALIMGLGQATLAIPPFFTADTAVLHSIYAAGEALVYASLVAQAAIIWCLMLRDRFSIYAVTVPIAVISLLSWLYAASHSTLKFSDNFITYHDPFISTVVIGLLLLGLFLPVGFYFLHAAALQTRPKAIATSVVLGLVYIGIGLSTGGLELLVGEVMTPFSALGDLAFFACLLAVTLWPRRLAASVTVASVANSKKA